MSRPVISTIPIVCAFAVAACATATTSGDRTTESGATTATPQASPDPQAVRLIAHGTELARGGLCARAMTEAFEPALAILERQHRTDRSLSASRLVDGAPPENTPPRLGPMWSDAMYLQAYCLVDAGRVAEGVLMLERALTLIPNDVVYACELGHVRQLEGRFDDAFVLYRGALENAQTLQRSWGMTGAMLFGQDLSWWARRALRGIGFSLVELGQLEAADTAYRQVLQIDPNDERALHELQLIATRRGAI